MRFTVDGSPALHEHLARTCARIAAGVSGLIPASRLELLLLGGGYGRGEGGVRRTAAGDEPYNDLEFYVFVRGSRHLNELRYGRALHVLGEILTPQAGIEVEFKLASLAELRRSPVSMFTCDLLRGHVVLAGDPARLAGCAFHAEAGRVPRSEATRLLMNRCSGLLLARERLEREIFTAADADFVRRNLAKAQLALGDALLVLDRQYVSSAIERHRHVARLAQIDSIPWLRDVARHHAEGVEFKLHPYRSEESAEELLAAHTAITALAGTVFLWVETQRLQRPFASLLEYATSPVPKLPALRGPRTALVNLKVLPPARALAQPLRHPRERVLHALALLLWQPAALSLPEPLRLLQRELATPARTYPELVAAYRRLWSRLS